MPTNSENKPYGSARTGNGTTGSNAEIAANGRANGAAASGVFDDVKQRVKLARR